jgi:O-antigen/teichoic acid export membrane protein
MTARRLSWFGQVVASVAGRVGRDDFWPSVATTMVGTVGSQVIGLFVLLTVARLYEPGEFAVFSFGLSVMGLFAILTTARYEHAIFLARDAKEAAELAALPIYLSVFGFMVLALFAPFEAHILVHLPWLAGQAGIIGMLAVGVAASGLLSTLTNFCTQSKRFRLLAGARLFQALSVAFLSAGFGLANWDGRGLLASFVTGQILMVAVLAWAVRQRLRQGFADWRIQRAHALAHIRFPRYQMPAEMLNHVGANFIALAAPSAFGAPIVGQHSLALRAVGAPGIFIGNAIGEVFRASISPQHTERAKLPALFTAATKRLSVFGACFFIPFLFLGPWLFSVAFGPEWSKAGQICQIMAPLFFAKFVVSPLSAVLLLAGRQRMDAVLQSMFLLTALAAFAVGTLLQDFFAMLMIMVVCHVAIYIVFYLASREAIRRLSVK